jgi:AcrR family transcriptional regulator
MPNAPVRRRPAATPTPEPARTPTLAERHTDHTRQWIVAAAVDLMEQPGAGPLTNAAIAERAGISERTVYRHFATRDALLDSLAAEVARRLGSPPVPATPAALLDYPAELFACFEARSQLTRSALNSDVFPRMRDGPAAQRWRGVQQVLADALPGLPEAERAIAAANLRYLLAATTWQYYRYQFGFSLEQTVRCVRLALVLQLKGLGLDLGATPGAGMGGRRRRVAGAAPVRRAGVRVE